MRQVHVVLDELERLLPGVVPSLEGDESAAHACLVRQLPTQVLLARQHHSPATKPMQERLCNGMPPRTVPKALRRKLNPLNCHMPAVLGHGWVKVCVDMVPAQPDEVLRAESAFLDECDPNAVRDRLRAMAELHASR